MTPLPHPIRVRNLSNDRLYDLIDISMVQAMSPLQNAGAPQLVLVFVTLDHEGNFAVTTETALYKAVDVSTESRGNVKPS